MCVYIYTHTYIMFSDQTARFNGVSGAAVARGLWGALWRFGWNNRKDSIQDSSLLNSNTVAKRETAN